MVVVVYRVNWLGQRPYLLNVDQVFVWDRGVGNFIPIA